MQVMRREIALTQSHHQIGIPYGRTPKPIIWLRTHGIKLLFNRELNLVCKKINRTDSLGME